MGHVHWLKNLFSTKTRLPGQKRKRKKKEKEKEKEEEEEVVHSYKLGFEYCILTSF